MARKNKAHQRDDWNFENPLNVKVKENLARLQQLAYTAQSEEEILDTLAHWGSDRSLVLNNTLSKILKVCAVGLFFLALFATNFNGFIAFFLLICSVLLFIYASLIEDDTAIFHQTIQQLVNRMIEFRTDLHFNQFPNVSLHQTNATYILARLENHLTALHDFVSKEDILEYASTTWTIADKEYPVLVFRCRVGTPIKQADWIRPDTPIPPEQQYNFTNRWGVCVFNMPSLSFVVSNSPMSSQLFPAMWKSSDIDFSKQFYIHGISELDLAKVMTPQRTLAIAEYLSQMKGYLTSYDDMDVMCYVNNVNLFKPIAKSKQDITDIHTLRAFLRTCQLEPYIRTKEKLMQLLQYFV